MKKTMSHTFIPHMLSFLLLLGSFFTVLIVLKNPDSGPLESDVTKAQLIKNTKPITPVKLAEPDSKSLPAPLVATNKADDLYQKALIAAQDNADDESARRLLQEALRENPNHIRAADELYANYAKRQDWEGALAAFQKLENDSLESSKAGLDYASGRLYLELGHPDQARIRLEEALASDADQPLIREQLALAYSSLGEREWARREWQRLAQDESAGLASHNAKIRLAEILFAEGRWAEAEVYAKDVLKQDPHNRLGTLLSEH